MKPCQLDHILTQAEHDNLCGLFHLLSKECTTDGLIGLISKSNPNPDFGCGNMKSFGYDYYCFKPNDCPYAKNTPSTHKPPFYKQVFDLISSALL